MESSNPDVGDDPQVQSYIGGHLTEGQYRHHSCKIRDRIDSWYDFFPFDRFGWTGDVLTFSTKAQMENFAKICQIELSVGSSRKE